MFTFLVSCFAITLTLKNKFLYWKWLYMLVANAFLSVKRNYLIFPHYSILTYKFFGLEHTVYKKKKRTHGNLLYKELVLFCKASLDFFSVLKTNTQEDRHSKRRNYKRHCIIFLYETWVQEKYANWVRHLCIHKPSINHVFLRAKLIIQGCANYPRVHISEKANPLLLLRVHDLTKFVMKAQASNSSSFREPV